MPVKQKWARRGPDSACTWWPRNIIVKYFGSEVIRRRDRFCGLVPVRAKKASTTWKKVSGCQKSAEEWSIALKIGACSKNKTQLSAWSNLTQIDLKVRNVFFHSFILVYCYVSPIQPPLKCISM